MQHDFVVFRKLKIETEISSDTFKLTANIAVL